MANLTIRNVPTEIHQSIKARAQRNGRSTEAEVRNILETIAANDSGPRFGDELAALGRKFGGIELDIERGDLPIQTASYR